MNSLKPVFTTALLVLAYASAAGAPRELTLLATSESNGLKQLAKQTTAIKEAIGGAPALVVELGSSIGYDRGLISWKKQEFRIEMLEAIGFDAITPNPQMLYGGFEFFSRRYSDPQGLRIAAANIIVRPGQSEELESVWPESFVVERAGVRIGVVGIVSQYRSWPRERRLATRVIQRSESKVLRQVIPALRSRADVIVVLFGGRRWERIEEFLGQLPPMDVAVFSGRSDSVGAKRYGQTLVMSTSPQHVLSAKFNLSDTMEISSVSTVAHLIDKFDPDTLVTKALSEFSDFHYKDRKESEMLEIPLRYALRLTSPLRISLKQDWDGASIHGSIIGAKGNRLKFTWSGRRLYGDDLSHRATQPVLGEPLPVYVALTNGSGPKRALTVGGEEELALIGAFQLNADRYFSREVQDSLLAAMEADRSAVLNIFDEGQTAALDLLQFSKFLTRQRARQAQSAPGYWERRSMVFLRLTGSSNGKVAGVELLKNYATQAFADSCITVVRKWRLPSEKVIGRSPFPRLAVFAMDRREASTEYGDIGRLPNKVREAFDSGGLHSWLAAYQDIDPGFSLDDFTTEGFHPFSPLPRAVQGDSVMIERKYQFGLALQRHPKGPVLDTMTNVVIEEDGSLILPSTREISIRSVDSHKMTHLWKGKVDLGAWITHNIFALVGRTQVRHPRFLGGMWGGFTVPAIWIGDIRAERLYIYRGSPLNIIDLPHVENKLRKMMTEVYPLLKFKDVGKEE